MYSLFVHRVIISFIVKSIEINPILLKTNKIIIISILNNDLIHIYSPYHFCQFENQPQLENSLFYP
ncbi:hypothetical protein XBFFL1_240004 [Xenorhabdus bovienii str. feltiae Florida]|uniref:Uncharacterized protein n=2 Tax=Xenorhabdus bovienii TaxID=40576 RepID=A0A0B6XDN7_XENBV|nr:hypothetical protein XBFFR1_2210014 [Xenorhabdus bovienii str. feltiae France]CDG93086.1 hypothetical protein XBFFL1_240004 [Xenorhabdus bovienii str. feltiae Florida]CDG99753.1 hypothetical protein XBFM1_1190013 [Xenorhabdus bovienii str. feltiae Moldova]CDM91665.1 protein of unknown function [Xenorhabdus bovienii]